MKVGLIVSTEKLFDVRAVCMLSVIYSNAFDYSIVRVIYLWNHVLCSRLLTSPFQWKLFGWLQDSNSYLKRPSFVMIVESAESDTQIFRIFFSIFSAIKLYRRHMDEVKDRPNVQLCYSFDFEWDSCRHHKQICQSHNFCQWQKCLLQLRTADVCDAMTCHGRRTSDWCMFDMHRRDTFARFFFISPHTHQMQQMLSIVFLCTQFVSMYHILRTKSKDIFVANDSVLIKRAR